MVCFWGKTTKCISEDMRAIGQSLFCLHPSHADVCLTCVTTIKSVQEEESILAISFWNAHQQAGNHNSGANTFLSHSPN